MNQPTTLITIMLIIHDYVFLLQTRVLVTNSLKYLPLTDFIVVLSDGKVSEMGSYTALLAKSGAFSELIEQFSVESSETGSTETAGSQSHSDRK